MKAWRIIITGLVQGVGFRPFIYRIAREANARGYVKNLGGSEVEVFLEGNERVLERFLELLNKSLPPPAEIESVEIHEERAEGFGEFKILPSGTLKRKISMIPPDFGICEECLAEVLNRKDRRYGYVFNSCAWCGPRFSIMFKVPYDRENTSMGSFPLCRLCLSEYEDPENFRRFHAQGISCPECGPRIWLEGSDGRILKVEDPLREAAQLIDEGRILAVKGLGGFHIAALASEDEVVLELRRRKKRPQKPFALMALDLETVNRIVYLDEKAIKVLTSPSKPILLLPEKDESPVSKYVAPGLSMQGVMLPYTALHYLLLAGTRDRFLIMTSGNRKGEPMCTSNMEARIKLRGVVDYFLMHNRRIVNRVDDSVLRPTAGQFTFIRRGRGFAPRWFKLPYSVSRNVIALGAELQTTAAIALENKAIVTQFIGDLESYEVLRDLERYLFFFIRAYNIDLSKAIIVIDKHPRYLNRILARRLVQEYGCDVLEVQHHHAHAVSVMVEKGFQPNDELVAITIDGVGYGTDGMAWGGEVLLANYFSFKRLGHLEYQPMPGGDRAVYYPVRMLVGILSSFLDEDEVERLIISRRLERGLEYGLEELKVSVRQAGSPNTPKTSGMGRVLDAVSALLGICLVRTYEGEPAMKLEAAGFKGKLIDDVEAPVIRTSKGYIVDTSSLFEKILENIDKKVEDLAFTAQYIVGEKLAEIALKHVGRSSYPKILVSGGAAVNTIILRAIKRKAENEDVEVIVNTRVPAGDGGISLGQVAIGGALEASEYLRY